MLIITVPGPNEAFNEATEEILTVGDVVLELEHSLLSISKWESQYEKPFLGKEDKTTEEIVGYVKAMTLTPNVSDDVFARLSSENFEKINAYINAKMTATWFNDRAPEPRNQEVITAELIYYWMTVFQIPFTCEEWHINKLFTLIKICNIKQSKPKKMSRREAADRQRELNAQRRAKLGTKG